MKLLILTGPPATGKSTFRKQLVDSDPTWSYVNLDELRLLLPTTPEQEIQKTQLEQANLKASLGYNLIIDNTNLNPKTRQRWIDWGQQNNYDVEIKEFGHDVPWYEAIERDLQRDNQVGRSVIIQMYIDAGIFKDQWFSGKRSSVIIDLDGTLCDLTHRRHYVQRESKKDWKGFFAEIDKDVPNPAVSMIYNMTVADGLAVIFLSGRPSEHRKVTERWLDKHGFEDYFALFMRPFNNKGDDTIIKEQLYRKYVEPYFDVKLVLDDRTRIVNMWRQLGLHCFQVAEGDF